MAQLDRSLTLTEFGEPAILNIAEWDSTGLEEAITVLTKAKILIARRSPKYIVLEPGQFVGKLILPGRSIQVLPRFPALFHSLRNIAFSASKSVTAYNSLAETTEAQAVDIARAFISATENNVYGGLPAHYAKARVTTSCPRGHILFHDTFTQFRARGIKHKVVALQTHREVPSPLSSVVKTVASILEGAYPLTSQLRQRLARLLPVFDSGQVESTAATLSAISDMETSFEEWPDVLLLLRLGRSIIQGEQAIWDFEMSLPGGECRFCNMNRLWEVAGAAALREVFGRMTNHEVVLHPIGSGMRLLQGGGPQIDPDVVIFENGHAKAVVDTKNSLANSVVADDVYQVLCYSRRLSARTGFLIYLTMGAPWFEAVGTSTEGIAIVAAGIPVSRTYHHLLGAAHKFAASVIGTEPSAQSGSSI